MEDMTNHHESDVPTIEDMYNIPLRQFLRLTAEVVKDWGEPRRRFRTVFSKAHVFFKENKNPSIHALNLEDTYNTQSINVVSSMLRARGIVGEHGFFTPEFHKAYYLKYQQVLCAKNISIEA